MVLFDLLRSTKSVFDNTLETLKCKSHNNDMNKSEPNVTSKTNGIQHDTITKYHNFNPSRFNDDANGMVRYVNMNLVLNNEEYIRYGPINHSQT